MTAPRLVAAAALLAWTIAEGETDAQSEGAVSPPDVRLFFQAASLEQGAAEAALEQIGARWRDGYSGLVLDLARFFPRSRPLSAAGTGGGVPDETPRVEDDALAGALPGRRVAFGGAGVTDEALSPRAQVRVRLVRFLERQTGRRFGHDLDRWRRWLWEREVEAHPEYALFKAALYGQIDPRFAEFFAPGSPPPRVRLDEVDWGGVGVDGIPPLDHPAHVGANAAGWLADDHVVFGIALGGEARAYPKRILAWHELARDRLGGVELAIVYCTLCGTVIPYGAEVGGVLRTFGTSGLLYRSNKLLYDAESRSLWSSVEGRPVIGPLAGQPLELTAYPVVTTTWGEWRRLHPATTVLSLATGHERDYSEGAAYRDYFATDRLMFEVPGTDRRLRNKDEVLALLLREPDAGPDAPRRALAIAARFLERRRLHALRFAGHELVVVTSRQGANRVYAAAGRRFAREAGDGRLEDADGGLWRVTETALVAEDGATLPRVPARRAFWFGWRAQFPDTQLVH